MSMFSKPLSQVGIADLQELLQEKAVENARLEFKLQVPSKDDTLKKLSSFANTFGGYMVVGAKASSSDGRIEDLPGADEEAGYKQKVVDWCFTHVSPPLTVEVSDPIPTQAGKVCYLVHTAESDVAPHFLNGRKGIWVRTDEFSARFEAQLANENELSHLLDRRKLIRKRRLSLLERARKRFDTYVGKITGVSRSVLEVCVVPRFPSRPLCEEEKLKPLITAKQLPWRQVGFPIHGSSIVSQHESSIVLGAVGHESLFEANVWGMMFYRTKIVEDNPANVYGIHLHGFLGTTLLFIRHAEMMLRALGYSGPVHVQMGLADVRGIPWLHSSGFGSAGIFTQEGSRLDNDVEFSIPTTTEILIKKPDIVVMELLRYVFFAVNWPDLVDRQSKIEDLLRQGYQYNLWKFPDSSQL